MGSVAPPLPLPVVARHPRLARGSRSLRFWAVAASILVLAGVGASLFAARVLAHDRASHSQLEFENSAKDVASTLELAIQREEDLVVNAAAFMAANPHGTQTQFLAWSKSVRALERYPELQGIGFVVIVPAPSSRPSPHASAPA